VACPFFVPIERLDAGWQHPIRLPLGCGWRGTCSAPGHEGAIPSPDELREFCNLGYAEGCNRLPRERAWDAVRFAVLASSRNESATEDRITGTFCVRYVCERGHRPAEHGTLVFNFAQSRWTQRHNDRNVQAMAECFLAEYFNRRKTQETARAAS
jgi:hypothetical protein